MNIRKANLQFGQLTKRKETTGIILHHPVWFNCTIEDIHRAHRNPPPNGNGWSGVGYHYLVRKNGEVWEGRPDNTVGAHAGAANNGHTIGICFEGNFHPSTRLSVDRSMNDVQFKAGQELLWFLYAKYPTIKWVKGHKEVGATECPGQFFPLAELKATPRTKPVPKIPKAPVLEIKRVLSLTRPFMTGNDVRSLQETLNRLINAQLVVDGVYGPATERAVKNFQRQAKITVDGIVGPQTVAALNKALNPPEARLFRVQVGAFSVRANADRMADRLRKDGYSPFVTTTGNLHRVQVGAFSVRANAQRLEAELKGKGYDTIIV